jgi:3-hydroxyisobutyrate dehydrogenase
MSGMRIGAENATLTFLLGGEADLIAKARRGLLAMGTNILHIGPIGAGQVVKLANSLVAMSTIMVVGEAVALTTAYGLSEEKLLNVLRISAGDSAVVRNWPFIAHQWANEHPFGAAGVTSLARKDLSLALEIGQAQNVSLPATTLALNVVPSLLTRNRPGASRGTRRSDKQETGQ